MTRKVPVRHAPKDPANGWGFYIVSLATACGQHINVWPYDRRLAKHPRLSTRPTNVTCKSCQRVILRKAATPKDTKIFKHAYARLIALGEGE